MSCRSPVPFEDLVDYWAGAPNPALEEHFFGCGECTGRLEALAGLAAAIAEAFRAGAVAVPVAPALVAAMRREGLRLREYRLAPGSEVQCTIGAEDDFVVARLAAPLAGVRQLDAVSMGEHGETRLADIPFDPAAGEVLLLPAAARLRQLSAHTQRVRLLAVQQAGERLLGEYTFVHTPG